MEKKLKLVSLINEQSTQNAKTLTQIVDFLKSASADFLNTQQGKQLKDVFVEFIPKELSISEPTKPEIQNERITSDDDFYKEILNCIGAPATKENMKFMYAWRQAEGGSAKNNPFNTTRKKPNTTFYNCLSKDSSGNCSSGVKNYQSKSDGISATCETLKLPMYSSLVNQLKNGKVEAYEMASNSEALKTWGTGDLIKKVLKGYKEGSSPKPPSIAA